MDETYIKAQGKWMYLYRAVDKYGNTIDFLPQEYRDLQAAKAFLKINKPKAVSQKVW